MATRKAGRKGSMMTRKMKGGNKMMYGGAKKGTPWTRFVKKMHMELKKKNPGASLGDAMKHASKNKHRM